ncbi:MAG: hypothetical protein LBB89_11510 [Treponema sp.]|nr:hypothetical protein [Treponema sp.]
MRNLMLLLIAFIAVVTFIRAFDNKADADTLHDLSRQPAVESVFHN